MRSLFCLSSLRRRALRVAFSAFSTLLSLSYSREVLERPADSSFLISFLISAMILYYWMLSCFSDFMFSFSVASKFYK